MFDWEPPENIESTKVRNSKKIIDPREIKAFKLTGDLWRVKFEMNDCDLHLEMTKPGGDSNDNRVIVEIPADKFAKNARGAVLDKLTELKQAKQAKKNGMDFKSGVPIRSREQHSLMELTGQRRIRRLVTATEQNSSRHFWELHPVFRISFPSE